MKLYAHPVSMVSRPVLLYIADQGIDIDVETVDILSGEHHGQAFVEINPNRQVPVLKDGDFILTEASAILKYLADTHDHKAYPTDLKARARVNERMDWVNTGFYRDYGYNLCYPQLFPHHKRPTDEGQKVTIEWGKEKSETWLQILNGYLAESDYIAGDSITIADYFASGPISLGEAIGVDFSKYPNVEAWFERIKSLEVYPEVAEFFNGFVASVKDNDYVSI